MQPPQQLPSQSLDALLDRRFLLLDFLASFLFISGKFIAAQRQLLHGHILTTSREQDRHKAMGWPIGSLACRCLLIGIFDPHM